MAHSQATVFIGNIPYDATDDELKAIFGKAGEIVHFRVVLDQETGRSRGFGFCEYTDEASAETALRNLNNHEFKNRTLRVDRASNKSGPTTGFQSSAPQTSGTHTAPAATAPSGQRPSVHGPPTQNTADIVKTMEDIPPQQMYTIMKEIQTLIQQQPDQARILLTQQPQLCFAFLQGLLRMGMIDSNIAQAMIDVPPGTVVQAPAQQPAHQPPPQQAPAPAARSAPPPHNRRDVDQSRGRSGYGRDPYHREREPAYDRSAPAARSGRGQPLPQAGGAPPPTTAATANPQDQAAILQQVMSLTDEQIRSLPPDQAQMLMKYRDTIRQNRS
eukprot:m.41273 g.41273  ORF g.41273 m.41273 type:complete len:329 (-) comp12821_c0_seq1:172-1158(-)